MHPNSFLFRVHLVIICNFFKLLKVHLLYFLL